MKINYDKVVDKGQKFVSFEDKIHGALNINVTKTKSVIVLGILTSKMTFFYNYIPKNCQKKQNKKTKKVLKIICELNCRPENAKEMHKTVVI